MTDQSPLLVPMIVDNRVFLATVGHFTIGWRAFSDWKVTVETGEADKTREIARFAIGMTKGPIASVTVKYPLDRWRQTECARSEKVNSNGKLKFKPTRTCPHLT